MINIFILKKQKNPIQSSIALKKTRSTLLSSILSTYKPRVLYYK